MKGAHLLRQAAEDGIAVRRRQAGHFGPLHHPHRHPLDGPSEGMRQELAAEADAEDGHTAVDGRAQELRFRLQVVVACDVAHRLVAAEREQRVGLVQRRERIAKLKIALLELQPGLAQRLCGMPEKRLVQVMQDNELRHLSSAASPLRPAPAAAASH
jgi:hypothetical protein